MDRCRPSSTIWISHAAGTVRILVCRVESANAAFCVDRLAHPCHASLRQSSHAGSESGGEAAYASECLVLNLRVLCWVQNVVMAKWFQFLLRLRSDFTCMLGRGGGRVGDLPPEAWSAGRSSWPQASSSRAGASTQSSMRTKSSWPGSWRRSRRTLLPRWAWAACSAPSSIWCGPTPPTRRPCSKRRRSPSDTQVQLLLVVLLMVC